MQVEFVEEDKKAKDPWDCIRPLLYAATVIWGIILVMIILSLPMIKSIVSNSNDTIDEGIQKIQVREVTNEQND